jgi:hypothetical protein
MNAVMKKALKEVPGDLLAIALGILAGYIIQAL